MAAAPISLLTWILGSPISSSVGLGQNWEDKCMNGTHKAPQKHIPYACAYLIPGAGFDQYLLQTDYFFQVLTALSVPKTSEGPRMLFSVGGYTNPKPIWQRLCCNSQSVLSNFTIYGSNTLCSEEEYQQHAVH